MVLVVKNPPTNAEDIKHAVWSLGQEDPLEVGVETQSSFLSWRVPWTEKPGGLQSMGSRRVRHNLGTKWQQEGTDNSRRKRTNSDLGREKHMAFYGSWGRLWNNFREKHFWDLPLHSPQKIHPFPGPKEPAFHQASGIQHCLQSLCLQLSPHGDQSTQPSGLFCWAYFWI